MKSAERILEQLSPSTGVRLRVLKKKLRHDMALRVIDALVGPGDHVLDVGAYRGTYTVALSRRVGPEGRVWAIEPFPPNAAALARLMAGRSNVTVCPWAASARPGRQVLTVPIFEGHRLGALATLGGVSVAGDAVEIDVRTVDDLLDGIDGRPKVTFIRCDVVGHEAAVLAGADRTLRTDQPALFVEIEQRHQSAPIEGTLDRLRELGYAGYFLRRDAFFPVASFDVQRDQLSLIPSTFVPYGMPVGYVHYFLFARPDTALERLPMG
jgi:FkbM family methyltransferase